VGVPSSRLGIRTDLLVKLYRSEQAQSFILWSRHSIRRAALSKEKQEEELEKIRKLEDYVKDLREDVDKRFNDLSERIGPVRHEAAKAVKERPLLALGFAFLVGVVVGVAISKPND